MKRTKLNYRFHNPNSAEDTADFLCKLMIEVNTGKMERAIEEAALYTENGEYISGGANGSSRRNMRMKSRVRKPCFFYLKENK